MFFSPRFSVVIFAGFIAAAGAAPLSKTQEIDFFRDVPSRNLQGTATRSDGRLLPGPAVTTVNARLEGALLWSLAPDGEKLLAGTGPDGKVLSLTPAADGTAKVETLLDLPETHVFAVARTGRDELLAGTSPQGALILARGGKVVARTILPVDSIFDLAALPATAGSTIVLVATGNPGRIYRVDLAAFAASGDHAEKVSDDKALAARGITLFGEIRDRNVRRVLPLASGRVIAGSAPKGNVYEFAAAGGAPRILAENRNAEVCDLLPWEGGFYAALTFASASGEARLNRPKPAAKTDDTAEAPSAGADADALPAPAAEPARVERFSGRSQLLWFPDNGFPETVASRNNVAFYRLARHGARILIAGGEQGELLGYDPQTQRGLTFAGAVSAQLNGLVPAAGAPDAFYAIGNNPSGLVRVDFGAGAQRSAETKRIDLNVPATIGQLQLGAASRLDPQVAAVELRTSFGSDEVEGWSPWQRATLHEGGWLVPGLRGRYVQVRLTPGSADFAVDKADLHFLPQNRRPALQDFRVLSPNYGLVPQPDSSAGATLTLGQLLQSGGRDDDKRRNPLLSSLVVPQPGAQVITWTVNDADGDNVQATLSIRRTGDTAWIDLAIDNRESFLQFDSSHLPEGVYQTRLVATETAPRPAAERLSALFETDDLLIDRTPPAIIDATAKREGGQLIVTVQARDALSLLAGMEISLNNGAKETVQQPLDGLLDGRDETFSASLSTAQAAGATAIEIIVYDAAGNSAARRIASP